MNSNSDKVPDDHLGGIGIDLTQESRQMLFDLFAQLVPEKDYYQSFDPGYTYINGNVAKKGHVTICYGVKNFNLKKHLEDSDLKINWQKTALIKEIQVNLGYQDLYYVIVAIPGIDKEIYAYSDWISANNELVPISPAFDPHIALGYIKNPGHFPSEILEELKEKLLGKSVEFESVNFNYVDDKVGSISI
jgi:hypothetical protein